MNTMKPTTQQILDAGFDASQLPHILALCEHLDCEPDDLSEARHDHWGLTLYSFGSQEYAIGTDSEADDAALENIKDSVWAFNASFILGECDLPMELKEGIKAMQEKECEGANDALLALVEKCCESQGGKSGIEAFAESAVSADGRGHFLSSYDGEENEVEVDAGDGQKVTLYIYRAN